MTNLRDKDMEKVTKTLVIGNITFILTACVSVGIYLATLNQHTKALEENAKTIYDIERNTRTVETVLDKKINDLKDVCMVKDTSNEKSVIAIEGKLGRIEDKLDAALTDLKDIKKIVLKPAISDIKTNDVDLIAAKMMKR